MSYKRNNYLKNILYKARYSLAATKRLQNSIDELKSMREKITPAYSDMPGGGGVHSKIEDITIKIVDLENELANKILQYLSEYKEAENLIAELDKYDARLSNIMRARYLDGERWEDIASEQNYSWQHLLKLHGESLKYLSKIYTKN